MKKTSKKTNNEKTRQPSKLKYVDQFVMFLFAKETGLDETARQYQIGRASCRERV